jgi:hypothetical protein
MKTTVTTEGWAPAARDYKTVRVRPRAVRRQNSGPVRRTLKTELECIPNGLLQ